MLNNVFCILLQVLVLTKI